MATFLTDMMEKGYTQEEVFDVVFESEQDRNCRRMQAIVTESVDANRLRKVRDLLAFEKLATWRRMNGFDRVVEGEENWFHGHRSLPLTPEQYTASLRSELQNLKNAISILLNLLRIGLGRRRCILLTDSKGNSRMRNLP